MNNNCIIVGASHAGVTLALQLRREGWEGPIQLIGEEHELPYHRPPLSKDLLSGSKDLDAIRLRPLKMYQDNDIELMLGSTVKSFDTTTKQVLLGDGRELNYAKLALCTGAKVRKLSLAKPLKNVFYIRSAQDIAALSTHIEAGKRAVIIGGGYIGLETAAVLAQKGLQVTVLEMAERVLQRVTSETMSTFMHQLHQRNGVEIVTSAQVQEIQGQESVERIVCADGEVYQADFLVAGIGVTPNSDLAESAGLDNSEGMKGIAVNEYGQTSSPDVYAAGDCVNHPSIIYGRRLSLESVQNANDQARVVAANICGKQKVYDAVPWFWSDQYHIKLQMTGLSEGYDQLVCRGDVSNSSGAGFALFYLKNGVVIAADCVARPKEFMVSKHLLKNKVKIDAAMLEDESIEPASLIS